MTLMTTYFFEEKPTKIFVYYIKMCIFAETNLKGIDIEAS